MIHLSYVNLPRLLSPILFPGPSSFLTFLFYFVIIYFIILLLIYQVIFLSSFEILLHIHFFVSQNTFSSKQQKTLFKWD